jgi:hypothetical protein
MKTTAKRQIEEYGKTGYNEERMKRGKERKGSQR